MSKREIICIRIYADNYPQAQAAVNKFNNGMGNLIAGTLITSR